MNRRSLLFRWFISYVAILIIPIALSVGIYIFSYDVIIKSTEKIYAASLERTAAEIDGMVRSIYQTLDQLTINSNVQKLAFVKDKPDPYQHWAIVELVRELRNFQVILPKIDNLFVVLNETGTIASTIGYVNVKIFHSINYGNTELDLDSFRNLLRKNHRNQTAYPAGDYLLFFRTVMDNNSGNGSVTVGAAVKQGNFEGRTGNENEPFVYIEDIGSGNEYPVSGKGLKPAERKTTVYKSLGVDSDFINWRYICLFPVSILKEQARKIQIITFIGFIISILLGLFLSYFLSKKNYEPVKKLMSFFKSPGKNDAPEENEFAWLEKQTGEFIRENNETRLAMRNYHTFFRYSNETEQKLVNLIRAGDGNGASALIKQVFADNTFPEDKSGRMLQFLAWDLLGTITKGIGNDEGDIPDDINIEEIPVPELPAFIEETAFTVCEIKRETVNSKNIKILCEKIKNYLKENFRNADLNISQTGYYFEISPFYLSGIFREETGQSLLDYLNMLRINEAKHLLEEGRNVNEIAGMTGFHGAAALIRVFKKNTGVTPGQYRKIS